MNNLVIPKADGTKVVLIVDVPTPDLLTAIQNRTGGQDTPLTSGSDWKGIVAIEGVNAYSIYINNQFVQLVSKKAMDKYSADNYKKLGALYEFKGDDANGIIEEMTKGEEAVAIDAMNDLAWKGTIDVINDSLAGQKATSDNLKSILGSVSVQEIIEANNVKGEVTAENFKNEFADKINQMFDAANFEHIDDLNDAFKNFLNFDGATERLNTLFQFLESKKELEKDIQSVTTEIIEKLNRASVFFKAGRQINNAWDGIKSKFSKPSWDEFSAGASGLKGDYELIRKHVAAKKQDLQNTLALIKKQLPDIAKDLVKLEYIEKVINKILESNLDLSEDAKMTLQKYRNGIMQIRQMGLIALTNITANKTLLRDCAENLNLADNQLVLSFGSALLAALVNKTVEDVQLTSKEIMSASQKIMQMNEATLEKNRAAAIESAKLELEDMKTLGENIDRISANYEGFHKQIISIAKDKEAYLPTYAQNLERLKGIQEKMMSDSATDTALFSKLKGEIETLNKGKAEIEQKAAAMESTTSKMSDLNNQNEQFLQSKWVDTASIKLKMK